MIKVNLKMMQKLLSNPQKEDVVIISYKGDYTPRFYFVSSRYKFIDNSFDCDTVEVYLDGFVEFCQDYTLNILTYILEKDVYLFRGDTLYFFYSGDYKAKDLLW